jgi:5'-3' exonuclease
VRACQLLFINLLREYLDEEFRTDLPFGYDLERILDDFVLFCFFVGTVVIHTVFKPQIAQLFN